MFCFPCFCTFLLYLRETFILQDRDGLRRVLNSYDSGDSSSYTPRRSNRVQHVGVSIIYCMLYAITTTVHEWMNEIYNWQSIVNPIQFGHKSFFLRMHKKKHPFTPNTKTIFCNVLDIHTIPLYNIQFKRYKWVWFVNNITKQEGSYSFDKNGFKI